MNDEIKNLKSTTFANKRFTRKQLSIIQETVKVFQSLSRRELGHTVCELIQWLTPSGTHKIQACLSALEEMEKIGLFTLPAIKTKKKKGTQKDILRTEKTNEQPDIDCRLEELQPIEIKRVFKKEDVDLWNEYVDRYHYLGYRRPIGVHSRYFIISGKGESEKILGCLLLSATAVFSMKARDQWIAWQKSDRKKRLNLVINNSRFLLFPWVKVRNLSSKCLSIISGQVTDDWQKDHGYQPVLMETLVDPEKFRGTGYKAAGWQRIGRTSGHKWSKKPNIQDNSRKDIYVYPLTDDFRSILTNKQSPKQTEKQPEKRRELTVDDPFIKLWQRIMDIVSALSQEYDRRWQKRQRAINTVLIILFVFRLVFSKNNQGYKITILELWDQCRRMNFPLPQSKPVAASAFCNARKKLDEHIFKEINTEVIDTYKDMESETDFQWKQHRVFGVDGSKINIPRQLKKYGYRTPSKNANYPQGLVSCLYQLKSYLPYDFDLVSHNNERTAALDHLKVLEQNDVVVYDRGYFSYAMLYYHKTRNVYVVFRMKKKTYKIIDNFIISNETDSVVTILPSKAGYKEIKLQYSDIELVPIKLRLIKYTYSDTTYILGTTLLDSEQYNILELSDLYHARWGIEELYKISKVLINIEEFHSQYERGIKQELFAHFVLITLNRILVNKAEDGFEKTETTTESSSKKSETKSEKIKANLKNALVTMARNLEGLFVRHVNMMTDVVNEIITSVSSCRQKERFNRKYERKSMKPPTKWRSSKKKMTTT